MKKQATSMTPKAAARIQRANAPKGAGFPARAQKAAAKNQPKGRK